MKLNPDCIRDILLTVEDVTDFYTTFEYPNDNYEKLKTYSVEEVLYHLRQCDNHKLISKYHFFMDGGVSVEDLSPEGHNFLSTVRSDTAWSKIKKSFFESGKHTLNNLISTAIKIVTKNTFDV